MLATTSNIKYGNISFNILFINDICHLRHNGEIMVMGYWTNKKGEDIEIKSMDDDHLANTIAMKRQGIVLKPRSLGITTLVGYGQTYIDLVAEQTKRMAARAYKYADLIEQIEESDNMKVTITINTEEIKKAIRAYAASNGFDIIGDMAFDIKNDYDNTVFLRGCSFDIQPLKADTNLDKDDF